MMVSQMGFSKLGQVAWQSGGGPSFVGASAGQAPDCSAHTADMIDAEIKELVERSYRYLSSYLQCLTHVCCSFATLRQLVLLIVVRHKRVAIA